MWMLKEKSLVKWRIFLEKEPRLKKVKLTGAFADV
jgi:hypothetical protein